MNCIVDTFNFANVITTLPGLDTDEETTAIFYRDNVYLQPNDTRQNFIIKYNNKQFLVNRAPHKEQSIYEWKDGSYLKTDSMADLTSAEVYARARSDKLLKKWYKSWLDLNQLNYWSPRDLQIAYGYFLSPLEVRVVRLYSSIIFLVIQRRPSLKKGVSKRKL